MAVETGRTSLCFPWSFRSYDLRPVFPRLPNSPKPVRMRDEQNYPQGAYPLSTEQLFRLRLGIYDLRMSVGGGEWTGKNVEMWRK